MRQRRRRNCGAGADDKTSGGHGFAIAERKGVFVVKAGTGADEFETSAAELLLAIFRELSDERIFTGHHFVQVETGGGNIQAPDFSLAREVEHVRGVEQRFGGHAAAQDAKAANLGASFNYD